MLTFALLVFSFSTVLGWSYYAERCLNYMGGARYINAFRVVWLVAIVVGASAHLQSVWDFSDMANALMAIPNLVIVWVLTKVAVVESRKFSSRGHIDEVDDEMEL